MSFVLTFVIKYRRIGSLNTNEKDVILIFAANPEYFIDLKTRLLDKISFKIGENEKYISNNNKTNKVPITKSSRDSISDKK